MPLKLAMINSATQGAAQQAWVELSRPLTTIALNNRLCGEYVKEEAGTPQGLLSGGVPAGHTLVSPTISLPIGTDIKSVTCTAADIDLGWQCINFTFGCLNLINPQGTIGGANLSMFDPRLQHDDRLVPWILSKTKVDVQVAAVTQNCAYYAANGEPKAQSAVFHGYAINAFQEEQVCAIQTRIETTDRNVGVAEVITCYRRALADETKSRPHYVPRLDGREHVELAGLKKARYRLRQFIAGV